MLKNVIVKTAWWKLYGGKLQGENCMVKTAWWKLQGENCMGKTAWGKLHGENCKGKTARGKLHGENYHGDKCLWWKRLHGEKCMGITTWWKLHGENDLGGNCYALVFPNWIQKYNVAIFITHIKYAMPKSLLDIWYDKVLSMICDNIICITNHL